MLKLNIQEDLEIMGRKLLRDKRKITKTIILCGGTGCTASGSREVIDALKKELVMQGMDSIARLRTTGCHGFCEQGPIAVIEPGNIFYCHVTPEDAHEIVVKTLQKGEVIERLLYTDPVSGEKIRTESEIPFYRAQDRQLLCQNREVDPCSIEDYIALGGYSALAKAIDSLAPEEIIREIRVSGLRGRGGRWFPHRAQVDGVS